MTLHLNLPGALGSRQAEQQQQHIRDARKELKERVRNDWDYPTLPAHRSCGHRAPAADEDDIADRIAGFRFHYARDPDGEGGATERSELGFEPTEWRERYYSSGSDSDSGGAKRGIGGKVRQKVYQFDSPDSVGSQISERRVARKRKRRQALEEEMEWNDGLAHWMRRRDTWSCARTETQVDRLKDHGPFPGVADQPGSAPSSSKSSLSSPSSTASANPEPAAPATAPAASSSIAGEIDSCGSTSTPISSPSTSPPAPLTVPSTPTQPPVLLLPVAPPLLPNNPIRRRISSNMYPDIYGKVILQSRAPSVPINLATLIRALVQGWKDDGEWPPKPAAPEKAIGRKKGTGEGGGGSSIGRGVKAVGRVLRLTGTGNGNGGGNAEQAVGGKKEGG